MGAHRARTAVRRIIGVGIVVLVIGGLLHMRAAEGQPATLSPLGVVLIGAREWLAGSRAALRVVVVNHAQGQPAARATVTIALKPAVGGGAQVLFRGATDRRGTLDADFAIPELEPGAYTLAVAARAGGLREEAQVSVTVRRSTQILLTTDKPIYQPSQVIHIRALALKRPDLAAAGEQETVVEVSDAKGNKVFKQALRTNRFGIAAADFQLADEVNIGRYTVRAVLGTDQAEKTVTVSRYVLPKFKLVLSTDRGYYLPGERVAGKLQADYFFGKPVANARVAISVKTFDVEFSEIQRIDGRTDLTGGFQFECRLPEHFVGQPLEQGKAFLQFEAQVTDQAEHTEKTVHTSTVAAERLTLHAVPEAGTLVPGVENLVYIMTALPTGEPVAATVRVEQATYGDLNLTVAPRDYRSDAVGIAEVPLAIPVVGSETPSGGRLARGQWGTPAGAPPGLSLTLKLAARTPDGTITHKDVTLSARPAEATSLLLRVDRPLAGVGETLNATALCSASSGTVYFDIVKDRQTMVTRAADITAGRALLSLRLSPELAGTVYLSAYQIMPDGHIVRDTRPLFVKGAADLAIRIDADRESYLPGAAARLAFSVTDPAGKPVAAALGINVVDESVFALQDLQPGMEKVFFYLEQELMKPRYEVHGFELPTLITRGNPEAGTAAWQSSAVRAARVVLAATELPALATVQVDTYADRVTVAREKWATAMAPTVERIRQALDGLNRRRKPALTATDGVAVLLRSGALTAAQLRDLWGRDLVLKPISFDGTKLAGVVVISRGPDGRLATVDDVIMSTLSPEHWFADEQDALRPPVMLMAAPMGGGAMKMARGRDLAEVAAIPVTRTPTPSDQTGAPAVRVREYFPETLFVEPALITDEAGKASLTIPMADSITTWRLAAMASSVVGQLGSTTQGLRCFQDFFVDIDLPVSLTQNDEVSIPVAVYNYLPGPQQVRLELAAGDWFALRGDATQTLALAANEVGVRYFTLKVNRIGTHPLTVHAYGSKLSDAIKRTIEVVPDGKQVESTWNGRLRGTVQQQVTIPAAAIAGASNILVKIYPGIFSQVVEGLDTILQMPFGCFEQTSSATWPNVMVLDYMKSTKQITPEIQMKAEGFINTGYQRMVSYEVPGGGFSWFGNAPANKLLTAYGLMEFCDMSAVHPVDPAVITRTQQWLLGQADARGAYKPDEAYLHGETWGKLQSEELLPTAYVLWGLTHTACRDPRVARSAEFVRSHWNKATEPYSLSIVANALVGADALSGGGDLSATTRQALEALLKLAKTRGEEMWWEAGVSGITNSSGRSADLEATGMAAIALIRSGLYGAQATQVLNYLIAAKDPHGTWHSTNATMLALRALTLAHKSAAARVTGEVSIDVNGQRAGAFAITPRDAEVVRVIDCKAFVRPGDNAVRVQFAGEGSALYQIVGRHYVPWAGKGTPAGEPLSIAVKYDKTALAKDDTIAARVQVQNNTPAAMGMVIIDLGIPPGFSTDPGEFAELVGSKRIDRFSVTGRQAIVYLEKLAPRQRIEFGYTLRARFPLKAKTPKSTVYEYYNPSNRADSEPVEMEVRGS